MPPAQMEHEAPLAWLEREKLHPGTTLADRVRKLRYKRRHPAAKVEPPLPVCECATKAMELGPVHGEVQL